MPGANDRSVGRYDRKSTAEQRAVGHCLDLMRATASLLVAGAGRMPTVTEILLLARVGRGTFYQHFAGTEAVVESMQFWLATSWPEPEACDFNGEAPHTALREWLERWFDVLRSEPTLAEAAVRFLAHAVAPALEDTLQVWTRAAERHGLIGVQADALQLRLAIAVVLRGAAEVHRRSPRELAAVVADSVVRLLR